MKMIEHRIQIIILKSRNKRVHVVIDGKNVFDQPINSELKTYENIRKIATGKGYNYTTGCLLDYFYFKENDKVIAIDLSKQQALDADPRAIQQINITANVHRAGSTTKFFVIEEVKETVLDFSQGTIKVLHSTAPLNAVKCKSKRNYPRVFEGNYKSFVESNQII